MAHRRGGTAGIGAESRTLLSLFALIGSSVLFLTGCSSAPSRNIPDAYAVLPAAAPPSLRAAIDARILLQREMEDVALAPT